MDSERLDEKTRKKNEMLVMQKIKAKRKIRVQREDIEDLNYRKTKIMTQKPMMRETKTFNIKQSKMIIEVQNYF